MLKTLLTATAISGLMFSSALAQSSAPTPPAASPSASTATPKAEATLPPDAAAKFVAAQSSSQWVASKFKGTDVLGPNNEHIGDVGDLLFDKDGKILAFIVGVGGFLGIGEKNVALAPDAFQMVSADSTRTSSAGANTGTATTASTASASDNPNDVKLKVSWTKDQLKSAPAFEYYKAQARTTGAGPAANTGMSQPAPATAR